MIRKFGVTTNASAGNSSSSNTATSPPPEPPQLEPLHQEDIDLEEQDPDFQGMDYRQFEHNGGHEFEMESNSGVPSSDSGISEGSAASPPPLSPGSDVMPLAANVTHGYPDRSSLSNYSSAVRKSVLQEEDLARIQLFHNSRKNVVHVCRCMVTLYKCQIKPRSKSTDKEEWRRVDEGALLLQMVKEPELPSWYSLGTLTLAKPLSGFDIWKDTLNRDSHYEVHNQSFHSVIYSKDRLIKFGFLFSHNPSAFDFQAEVTIFLDNSQELQSFDKKERKKRIKEYRRLKKRLDINDISIPLDYRHITCLDPNLISDPKEMSEAAATAALY